MQNVQWQICIVMFSQRENMTSQSFLDYNIRLQSAYHPSEWTMAHDFQSGCTYYKGGGAAINEVTLLTGLFNTIIYRGLRSVWHHAILLLLLFWKCIICIWTPEHLKIKSFPDRWDQKRFCFLNCLLFMLHCHSHNKPCSHVTTHLSPDLQSSADC